ncbi:hypothetical protein [Micromonospora sp. NPDC048843]|uniref:hypothetical protein n=1 Tax=Micromonospora sp. NPDC048843 TaxID=3155389 RepID=UPI00340B72F5
MRKFQQAMLAMLITLTVAIGGVASQPAPAGADPTGQYTSYCIGTNGVSFLWTTDYYRCNGWIDRYINGNQVAHLDYRNHYAEWQRGIPGVVISVDCAVAGALVGLTLAFTPVGWVSVGLSLVGLGWSCRNGFEATRSHRC